MSDIAVMPQAWDRQEYETQLPLSVLPVLAGVALTSDSALTCLPSTIVGQAGPATVKARSSPSPPEPACDERDCTELPRDLTSGFQ